MWTTHSLCVHHRRFQVFLVALLHQHLLASVYMFSPPTPQASNEVLQVENSSLGSRVESLEEECEERSRNANTWFESLQVR